MKTGIRRKATVRKKTMKKKILLSACATLIVASLQLADAQQATKVSRIGILVYNVARSNSNVAAFFQELQRRGWVEGQNVAFEFRTAEGKIDRLPDMAAELARLKLDVIVASATPSALAVQKATTTIPVVFTAVSDPVGSGLVASLARPGGNITGLANLNTDLGAKRLELLKESFPRVSRVAVLSNPTDPISAPELKEVETAARALRLQLQFFESRDANDFDVIASALAKTRFGALFVVTSQMFVGHLARVVDMAAKSRLPAIFWNSSFVDAGGLMSYGTNITDLYRRAAIYVDKILKGAKPADLPVEQPTKFELVINLKAAKQIGLTIPPNVLARADKVIK
jgi:putative ABC transport system substrate-binding protein